ncbi:hypothetical protein [Marinicella rhabdoformis]|uniref:hypothetical protein n=1 Tax=Marinicella rhabdoformis TaxID=2580566 RepID=UPI0012AEDC9A|nr:hypothetical protein [Marinicella rhabdoformis]
MRCLMVLLLFVAGNVVANEYIHGTVKLKSGESHTGILRWDEDEETFWSDHFNGEKSEIPQYKTLSDDIKEQIEDAQVGPKLNLLSFKITLSSVFADDIENPDFIVPFAAIAKLLTVTDDSGSRGLKIELHNGDVFESYEGSNDLNADVFVKKSDGTTGEFRMKQIESITFSRAADGLSGFDQGIYAVVDSKLGTFKGRIQWDRDERFLKEAIDGSDLANPENEELSIPLSDIESIEKKEKGSLLTLQNGKQLHLSGTNDVDADNRGIFIDTPEKGRMSLPWEQFKKMAIQEFPQNDWQEYHSLISKKGKLNAQLTLKDGAQISAKNLVYNMAQTSPAEMIRCTVKGMDYYLPLFQIKSIEPKSNQHALVTLIDGEQVEMFDSASFTEENLGLLFSVDGVSKYVNWKDVKKVDFEH